jgi:hypothetical protein
MKIDTTFDVRADSKGRNPDSASPTLLNYHQNLWSKPLPSGAIFDLHKVPGKYLIHESPLGTFQLSSDTISNSMRSHKSLATLISQIPVADLDAFQALGSTIGARVLFPGNKIDGKPTINVARGFNSRIVDRIDWSLECIRLHYLGDPSPLSEALARYKDFFNLFGDFSGYIDFFLLNDFADGNGVHRLISADPVFGSPRPNSVDAYLEYMANSMKFVEARNRRIEAWVAKN